MDSVKVELNEAEIGKMSDSDKLTFLVKIAFANRNDLIAINKILFGNGKKGMCERVIIQGQNILGLWATVIGAGGIIMAIIINHITK
jgi:hypothetical protein